MWRLFQELEEDYTKVQCLVTGCTSILSRGRPGSKRGDLNSNNMVRHARDCHPNEFKEIMEEEEQEAKKKKEEEENEKKKNETEKGGNQIWHLKSKKERLFKRVSIFEL